MKTSITILRKKQEVDGVIIPTVSEFYSRVLSNDLTPPLFSFYLGLGQSLTPEDRIANELFIKVNSECIETLKQASKYPICRFPIDFGLHYTVLEHLHLGNFNRSAALIATETILAANAGNSALVTNNILTILRVSDALDCESTLHLYRKKLEIITLGVKIIEYSLSIDPDFIPDL